jgi:hypothetical protein
VRDLQALGDVSTGNHSILRAGTYRMSPRQSMFGWARFFLSSAFFGSFQIVFTSDPTRWAISSR